MKIQKIYLFLPVSRSKILRFLVIFFFFFLFRYFMKTFSRFFDKRILKILCKSTVKNRRETVPPAVPFFLCKSIFIQNDGERSIITELNFHIGSEFSMLHNRNSLPAACKHIFIELLRVIRRTCLCKSGTVSMPAIGIERKLRHQKKLSSHIFQGKIGLAVLILEDPKTKHFLQILICHRFII